MRALTGSDGDTTGSQIAFAISATTPTTLAALPVKAYANGQMAFVTTPARAAGAQIFVLSPATSGAANADNVIATADDSSRQWIEFGLFGSYKLYTTPILDFTQTGSTLVMPAIKGYYPVLTTSRVWLTTTAGTLSTSPTTSLGNDATQANAYVAQTPNLSAGFTTGAPVQINNVTSPVNTSLHNVDMNGAPLYFKITVGATGTGGFALQGRVTVLGAYVPV